MFILSVFLIGIANKGYACDVVCLENCTEPKESCLMTCGCDSEMKDLKDAFRESGGPMTFIRNSEEPGITEDSSESVIGCQISCTGMCMKYAQGWALAQCLEACGCDNDTILRAKASGSNFLMDRNKIQNDANLLSINENIPLHVSEENLYDQTGLNLSEPLDCKRKCIQLCKQIPKEKCLESCVSNFCISDWHELIPSSLFLELLVLILSGIIVIYAVKYINETHRKSHYSSDFYKALNSNHYINT